MSTVSVSSTSSSRRSSKGALSRLTSMLRGHKVAKPQQSGFKPGEVTQPVLVALPGQVASTSVPARKHKSDIDRVKQANHVAGGTLAANSTMR